MKPLFPALPREADSAKDGLEARFGSDGIEPRLHQHEGNEPPRPGVGSFFEPGERLVTATGLDETRG